MWLIWVGAVIVLALLAVAVYLHWRLHQVRSAQKKLQQELEVKRSDARKSANDSIQIVSRAYLQKQVETAEACLRLCGLMDQLGVPPEERGDYVPIAKMADSIRHIPILDEWKSLPTSKKREFQKYIKRRESEIETDVEKAVAKLIGKRF